MDAALLRLRGRERALEVRVLRGLIELDRRKVYLDWGYASLFAYCVERLGYCESSAGRRIAAARAMARFPRIEAMLLSGELRLSRVAMAAKSIAKDERVLDRIRGKTQGEVEELLAPEGDLPELRFVAGPAVREKFERARSLLSGKHPEGVTGEQVLEAALDEYLKRHDPGRDRPPRKRSPGGSRRRSRHVPPSIRRAVWRRDEGRCAYRSVGGRRCNSTWDLEIDHIELFCRGGSHREENLRLLCSAHNRREAERKLGAGWMRQFC